MFVFGLQLCRFSAIVVTYDSKILVYTGVRLSVRLAYGYNVMRIAVRNRVRGRIRVRQRVRDRDRRSEPYRRSEAINFGANSDRHLNLTRCFLQSLCYLFIKGTLSDLT